MYREFLWAPWIARNWLRHHPVDLLHSTSGYFIDPPPNLCHVITLHDLAVLHFPERFRRWQLLSFRHRLSKLRNASLIICVSQFTANDAAELLHLPQTMLRVVHSGCDLNTSMMEQQPKLANPLPSSFSYLLVLWSQVKTWLC